MKRRIYKYPVVGRSIFNAAFTSIFNAAFTSIFNAAFTLTSAEYRLLKVSD
jgi:hypothetical protein